MANINVNKQIERVEADIEAIAKHIALHSGIPKDHAWSIWLRADKIARVANMISNDAREIHEKEEKKKK